MATRTHRTPATTERDPVVASLAVSDTVHPTAASVGVRLAVPLAAVAILVLYGGVHVYRLAHTPGWDPQEGYNLDIAWNLLHGRLRLFAFTSAFAQHPPLFYLQLALLIHLFGYTVATLRALVALYAILTCAALLAFSWRLLGTGPAFWGALVFAGAPLFLANTRWGYSYAQLMFVAVLCVWATWRYLETTSTTWLLIAACLAGVGVLSDYEGIALVALVLLVALRCQPRATLPTAAMALGLPLVGMLICLALAPSVFGPDLIDTFTRASGSSFVLSALDLLVNYYRFATLDVWVLLGLVGLFLIPARRSRLFLLLATGILGLVVLKVREIGPSFHTAVPLLPFLALGAGVAIDVAVRHLYAAVTGALDSWAAAWRGDAAASVAPAGPRPAWPLADLPAPVRAAITLRGRNALAAFVVFMAIASPLAMAFAVDAVGLSTTLSTNNSALLAASPDDAQAVAAYVLAHERPGDLALASPQVAWMLDQPDNAGGHPRALYGADLLQALAAQGQPAAFYPAGLPARRWAFPVTLPHARYVIVDNLLRQLAAPGQVAGLSRILATAESWPIVYRRGEYAVYARPGVRVAGKG